MSELSTLVKGDWDHFFSIVNLEEGWIIPLLSAVEGVTYEQAFWRPRGSVTSIVEVVMHANGWLGSTLNEILGLPELENEDWPQAPAPSERAWADVVARLRQTVADVSRALHNLSLEELYGAPSGRESKRSTMLTGILVHNAYHAGQIVKLRQVYEAIEARPLAGQAS